MSDYWRKRQAEHIQMAMDTAEDSAAEIAKLYQKASFYLNEQMQGIFDKYKAKHGLSDVEAKSLLNSITDDLTYEKMLTRLRTGVKSEERKKLLKTLEAPAYSYRINRFQEAQSLLDSMMVGIFKQEKEISTLNYIDVAYNAYFNSIYNIQNKTGINFSFGNIDSEVTQKLLKSKWSGKNYSERIWNNTQAVANSVKEEMLMGILTGKTEKQMADTISERFNVGAYNAKRLISTESDFISNALDMEAYREADIEIVRFCAVHDMKTSKICQRHDRTTIPLNKAIHGVNIPPMHPNCRSSIEPVINKAIEAKMKRRVRDPITGKDKIVSANQNYQEWLRKYQKEHGIETLEKFKERIMNKNTQKSMYDSKSISNNNIRKSLSKDLPDIFNYSKEKRDNLLNSYIKIDKAFQKTGFEYMTINYSSDGKETGLGLLTANSSKKVAITKEAEHFIDSCAENSLIAIHNHPSKGSFSIGDIFTYYNTPQFKEIVVINEEGGVFYLHINDRSAILKEREFTNYVLEIRRQVASKYPMFNVNERNHIAWSLVAKEIGWDYGYKKIK